MKRLKKGPELKMPELKVPTFLADLYYDLRDRRLLPLVALAVVAIAAVPFLLGGEVEEPPLPAPAAALESSTGKTSKLTVVEATPGLRDYRKRLRDRTPIDPFQQHYTGPAGGSAASASGGATTSSSESSSSNAFSEEAVTTEGSGATVEVETGGGSSGGSSNGGGAGSGGGGKPHLVLFDYAIDVRISRSEGSDDSSGSAAPQPQEPGVKHRVLPQTALPGENAPVVTYMGPGRKDGNKATGKVLLVVSGDVSSISGEYRCVAGAGDDCQMLEVEPGFPLTFVYGDNGTRYTIKVLKIELVVTGHT